jgi:hypothetical protein
VDSSTVEPPRARSTASASSETSSASASSARSAARVASDASSPSAPSASQTSLRACRIAHAGKRSATTLSARISSSRRTPVSCASWSPSRRNGTRISSTS